ncbi:MAG TPA: hypothetical protein VNS22_27560 [Geminicoccus sp.]|uniref:hypothetical protein n=1 Tax=Geminicoccus sp. TaxID=2024832 RepID=UPI002C082F2D|nr:hypothetical protein [Geminicoccus sp.]HWL72117.1 hypothetical protein [Geminicoccus sp.]
MTTLFADRRLADHRGKVREVRTDTGSWLHLFRGLWRLAKDADAIPALLEANAEELKRLAAQDERVARAAKLLEDRR